MLDEFVALVGCHRKHAVRLLRQDDKLTARSVPKGQCIYDEAVREALTVVWEASDRICGKRLKAALPSMVESLERHGHLDLDPRGTETAIFRECGDHRQTAEAHQGAGGKPQEAQAEEEGGWPYSGAYLLRLERT